MKVGTSFLVASILLGAAGTVFADSVCSNTGYTVIYVNGISTDRTQADDDRHALSDKFISRGGDPSIVFLTGYNQTHAGGLGDKLESVAQTYLEGNAILSDYDLKTILINLAPQVHTQKILLVGHSQGTFYTNAMYDYLIAHGVSPSSIAVYNLATPASYVAGKGNYTTSSYDKVIEYVRELDAEANAPQPLPPNINIPLPYDEQNDDWGGHHFQSDYLEGAPGQIVMDMQDALAKLKSSGTDTPGLCFTPPQQDLAYKAAGTAFALLDPATHGIQSTGAAIASAAQTMQSAVANSISNAWYSVVPKPSPDAAAGGMPLVKALYGSSIDAETAMELAQEQKAEAAAQAQQEAAAKAAAESAPRVEAFKPKAYIPPAASQSGAAALALVADDAVNEATPPAIDAPPIPQHDLVPIQPGFGGGGGSSAASSAHAGSSVPVPVTPPDLAISSPDDETTYATTSLTVTGTSTPGASISATGSASGSATADGSGNWTMPLVLPAGTSTVSFVASKDGADSATITRTIGIAVPPPGTPAASIPACAYSLTTTACVLPLSSVTTTWTPADNAERYDIYVNGVLAKSETSTSTSISIATGATSTIRIVAVNVLGDTATSSSVDVVSVARPVRINEIAWAGTASNASDQWLELRNEIGYTLDLSHVALVSRSSAFYVPLSGTISVPGTLGGSGYYLIEPRQDATNVTADLVSPFSSLSASGEQLAIEWWDGTATTTLDESPAVATCSGWCAGKAFHALGTSAQSGVPDAWATQSMERIGDDGTLASSWQTNDTYTQISGDVGSQPVYGSPQHANSNGWPTAGLYCGDAVYAQTDSPSFTVPISCTMLSTFISPRANRYVGLFIGDVGSSTFVTAFSAGKSNQSGLALDGSGMNAGDHAFVAVWENRTNVSTDVQGFEDYFTGAATSGPPHSNFAVFPWVRQ